MKISMLKMVQIHKIYPESFNGLIGKQIVWWTSDQRHRLLYTWLIDWISNRLICLLAQMIWLSNWLIELLVQCLVGWLLHPDLPDNMVSYFLTSCLTRLHGDRLAGILMCLPAACMKNYLLGTWFSRLYAGRFSSSGHKLIPNQAPKGHCLVLLGTEGIRRICDLFGYIYCFLNITWLDTVTWHCRDRVSSCNIYIYIYMYMCVCVCIYIYIYICSPTRYTMWFNE